MHYNLVCTIMKASSRMLIYFLVLLFCLSSLNTSAQNVIGNNYGLKVINNLDIYKATVNQNSENKLVDIATYIPGIQLDIRYATADNFMKNRFIA